MKSRALTSVMLSLFVLLLVVANHVLVPVNFLIFSFSAPLSLILIFCIASSIFATFTIAKIKENNYQKLLKDKNRQISKLKKANSMLNNSNFNQESCEKEEQRSQDEIEDLYETLIKTYTPSVTTLPKKLKSVSKKDIGKPYDIFEQNEIEEKSLNDILADKKIQEVPNAQTIKSKSIEFDTLDKALESLEKSSKVFEVKEISDNKTDTSRISKEDSKKLDNYFKSFENLVDNEFSIKNNSTKQKDIDDTPWYMKSDFVKPYKKQDNITENRLNQIIDLKGEFNKFLENTLTFSKTEFKISDVPTFDELNQNLEISEEILENSNQQNNKSHLQDEESVKESITESDVAINVPDIPTNNVAESNALDIKEQPIKNNQKNTKSFARKKIKSINTKSLNKHKKNEITEETIETNTISNVPKHEKTYIQSSKIIDDNKIYDNKIKLADNYNEQREFNYEYQENSLQFQEMIGNDQSEEYAYTLPSQNFSKVQQENKLSRDSVIARFNKPYDVNLYKDCELAVFEHSSIGERKKALINELFSGKRVFKR